MSRSLRHSVISLFIVLAWGSGWLMLWTLGFYLTHNGQQAALFLPHGVYLALLILLSRRYWPALVLPPVLMLLWLHGEHLLNGYILLAAPLIGLLPAGLAQQFWHRFPLYWQRLTLLLATVTASALLNTALLSPFVKSPAMMLGLASFTGGVLLTPFVYLIFEFLRQQHRYHLLGLDTNNPPLRTSLIIWCSLFFIIGIGTQMVLSPEIERLLLIVVFLPNVVMAWKFHPGAARHRAGHCHQPPAAPGAKPAPLPPAAGGGAGGAAGAGRKADPYRRGYAQKPGARAARRNRPEYYRHSDPVAAGEAGARSGANPGRRQPD